MPVRIPAYTFPSTVALTPDAMRDWIDVVNSLFSRDMQEIELYSSAIPAADISGLTSRQVVFGAANGRIAQSASLIFDSTVGGLTVTGPFQSSASTMASLVVSGALSASASTLASLVVPGTFQSSNATLLGTLTVAGLSSLAGLHVTGPTTLNALQSSNTTVNNLQVNGSATFASGVTFGGGVSGGLGDTTVSGLHVSSNMLVDGNSTFTGTLKVNSTAIGVFGVALATRASSYTTAAFTTGRVFGSTLATGGGASTLSSHYNQLLGVVACIAKDLGVGGAGYGWLR